MTTTEFIVSKLIVIANETIAKYQADLDDHAARIEAYKQRHLADWQRVNLPRIRRVRDALTAAIKTGKPIYLKPELKLDGLLYVEPKSGDYGFDQRVSNPANGSRKAVQGRVDELRSIVDALEAQTGKTISVNQLRLIGVPKIGDLFRAAAITKEPK